MSKKTKPKSNKIKGVKLCPCGRYRISVWPPAAAGRKGTRRQRLLPHGTTLGQAIDARNQWAAQAKQAVAPQGAQEVPTLATYAASWLLRKVRSLRPRTAQGYASHLEIYARPRFGALPLDQIRRIDLVRWRDWLETARVCHPPRPGKKRAHHPRDGQPMSQSLVGNVWAITLRVIRDGLADYELPDPTARIDPPKRAEGKKGAPRVLSPDELGRLLDTMQGRTRMHSLFVLLACTGLRQGEARELTWDRLDLCGGVGWIRLRREDTKTKTPRLVPVPEPALSLLRQMRAAITKEGRVPSGLLWMVERGPRKGLCMTAPRVVQDLRRWGDLASLGAVRPHDLRHTFITHALEAGAHPETLRQAVGHSDAKMTRHYYQATRGALEKLSHTACQIGPHAPPQGEKPQPKTSTVHILHG